MQVSISARDPEKYCSCFGVSETFLTDNPNLNIRFTMYVLWFSTVPLVGSVSAHVGRAAA
jgi:hypothetical protein